DAQDNAHIAGYTDSAAFPLSNPLQSAPGGGVCYSPHGGPVPCDNAFVTKISADGTALLYSTYMGGAGNNEGVANAIDAGGHAIVEGNTAANSGFPLTSDALLHCNNAGNASFISGLSASGGLAYATFFHGYDYHPTIDAFAARDPQHIYFA